MLKAAITIIGLVLIMGYAMQSVDAAGPLPNGFTLEISQDGEVAKIHGVTDNVSKMVVYNPNDAYHGLSAVISNGIATFDTVVDSKYSLFIYYNDSTPNSTTSTFFQFTTILESAEMTQHVSGTEVKFTGYNGEQLPTHIKLIDSSEGPTNFNKILFTLLHPQTITVYTPAEIALSIFEDMFFILESNSNLGVIINPSGAEYETGTNLKVGVTFSNLLEGGVYKAMYSHDKTVFLMLSEAHYSSMINFSFFVNYDGLGVSINNIDVKSAVYKDGVLVEEKLPTNNFTTFDGLTEYETYTLRVYYSDSRYFEETFYTLNYTERMAQLTAAALPMTVEERVTEYVKTQNIVINTEVERKVIEKIVKEITRAVVDATVVGHASPHLQGDDLIDELLTNADYKAAWDMFVADTDRTDNEVIHDGTAPHDDTGVPTGTVEYKYTVNGHDYFFSASDLPEITLDEIIVTLYEDPKKKSHKVRGTAPIITEVLINGIDVVQDNKREQIRVDSMSTSGFVTLQVTVYDKENNIETLEVFVEEKTQVFKAIIYEDDGHGVKDNSTIDTEIDELDQSPTFWKFTEVDFKDMGKIIGGDLIIEEGNIGSKEYKFITFTMMLEVSEEMEGADIYLRIFDTTMLMDQYKIVQ